MSDNIAQLSRSTALNLRSNVLTEIPSGVFAMPQLTVLHLTSNSLAALTPAIGDLTQLTDLFLDENRLEVLPSAIGRLRALTTLRLDRNALTSVPHELGRLQALRWLFLTNNRLRWLPISLQALPTTTRLLVSGNPLPIPVSESKRGLHSSRPVLDEILAATTAIGMIAEPATTAAIGLQDLELPALVTLEIIDALFANNIRMAAKWDLVCAVKHFHQRRQR